MFAITTGALHRRFWHEAAADFFAEGFERPTVDPVLAGKFIIINLRDVTEGTWYGYDWQLHLTVAVATDPFGPYNATPHYAEGVAVLASQTMPVIDSIPGMQRQVPDVLAWARSVAPPAATPHSVRAANQIAQAEYYRVKAEGARQGVADRLWRDRLLDDADPAVRADMAAWVHEFGERSMPLARESSLHDMALMRRGLLAD